jgi:hypothetical protein
MKLWKIHAFLNSCFTLLNVQVLNYTIFVVVDGDGDGHSSIVIFSDWWHRREIIQPFGCKRRMSWCEERNFWCNCLYWRKTAILLPPEPETFSLPSPLPDWSQGTPIFHQFLFSSLLVSFILCWVLICFLVGGCFWFIGFLLLHINMDHSWAYVFFFWMVYSVFSFFLLPLDVHEWLYLSIWSSPSLIADASFLMRIGTSPCFFNTLVFLSSWTLLFCL